MENITKQDYFKKISKKFTNVYSLIKLFLGSISSTFFVHVFCTNINLAAFSSCMYIVKAAKTYVHTKNLYVLCWWNWHPFTLESFFKSNQIIMFDPYETSSLFYWKIFDLIHAHKNSCSRYKVRILFSSELFTSRMKCKKKTYLFNLHFLGLTADGISWN